MASMLTNASAITQIASIPIVVNTCSVVISMVSILFLYAGTAGRLPEKWIPFARQYAPLLIQFSFGGLLSGMLIFYGPSSTSAIKNKIGAKINAISMITIATRSRRRRFWIISIILALISMSTLKLR